MKEKMDTRKRTETKYVVKDVFKEPDRGRRNEKVLELIKKQFLQNKDT